MSGGVVGRRMRVAYAVSNTWSVPATVVQQIFLMNTEGFDAKPDLVVDESFGQDFIGLGEIGDHQPLTPDLSMQLRFEQGSDAFLAGAMGSAAAPTVVSSQAATSLVAYSHILTLSPDLTKFFTLATDYTRYVQEMRTFKISGFDLKVGQNGRYEVNFSTVGDKTVYDSTTNTNSAVWSATICTPGNRAFRRLTRLRMNPMAAGALGAGDEVGIAREFSLNFSRPLAQDHVLNSDTIIEADDDGIFEGTLEVTYARMTSAAANSFATGMQAGQAFKADFLMLGTYINSHTQRSILWEIPGAQVDSGGYKAVVSGHGQVRPVVTFKLYAAPAAPTGMAGLTSPLRITVVNGRDTNLLE